MAKTKYMIFKSIIYKFIVSVFLISTPISMHAQENPDLEEIKGTFTVYVKSQKEKHANFSEEQLLEIESLRKEAEDFKTSIGGFKILIMSREKMEANIKWPERTIQRK